MKAIKQKNRNSVLLHNSIFLTKLDLLCTSTCICEVFVCVKDTKHVFLSAVLSDVDLAETSDGGYTSLSGLQQAASLATALGDGDRYMVLYDYTAQVRTESRLKSSKLESISVYVPEMYLCCWVQII